MIDGINFEFGEALADKVSILIRAILADVDQADLFRFMAVLSSIDKKLSEDMDPDREQEFNEMIEGWGQKIGDRISVNAKALIGVLEVADGLLSLRGMRRGC